MKTNEKLDKDRFRQSLGGEAEAYQEVARRLGLLPGEASVLDLDEHREAGTLDFSREAAKIAKASALPPVLRASACPKVTLRCRDLRPGPLDYRVPDGMLSTRAASSSRPLARAS